MATPPHILILAAGQGKRMRSELPKVLHPVLFRPMLHHVIRSAESIPHASINVVVGHGETQVREACAGFSNLTFFKQERQRGTADAVKAAEGFLKGKKGSVLVLSGDVILLRPETLVKLLTLHAEQNAQCTFLTGITEKPTGYGRILRDGSGEPTGIREEADCSATERAIQEINCGIYCFDIAALFEGLSQIGNRNKQGEYYLTDVVEYLVGKKSKVVAHTLSDFGEAAGINDRIDLAAAEAVLQNRINRSWMEKGVTLHQPSTIFISPDCQFENDVEIEAGCVIVASKIGSGTHIESHCRIIDTEIGTRSHIKQGSYLTQSKVGPGCSVGPFAHCRPKSVLSRDVKLGNFVEVKNSIMGEGSKASHLSYIGDAEIGKNVNLGCGFITCNFDGGPKKHKTTIEDDVFVGSDSQTIAPVRIGSGSYVASGTTVTRDVPADALAISRGKQVNKEGYAPKLRKKH